MCDEPTGALDFETGKKVLELLQNTCRVSGMTVVIITHNAAISQMANKVIKMKNGGIEEIQINEKTVDIKEINW
ncbi:putative ABC transporter ATP-binding protein [compost metagenome]